MPVSSAAFNTVRELRSEVRQDECFIASHQKESSKGHVVENSQKGFK